MMEKEQQQQQMLSKEEVVKIKVHHVPLTRQGRLTF
jgi:hypothetical protein